jgi:hypothetical protein
VWIEVPFTGLSKGIGKYSIGLKPSGESIDKAWVLDPWYNSSWSYRKAITIAHTADGAQTNYQMKLLIGESSGAVGEQVDCGGHVASDFDDLRFTTSDGITLCDYWIEGLSGATPNQLATVWIEVLTIAAHPNDTTVYMYYGNASAIAYGNITNTFLFGDDFSTAWNNPAKWEGHTADGSVVSGILTLTNPGAGECYVNSIDNYSGDIALRARVNMAAVDYAQLNFHEDWAGDNDYILAGHNSEVTNHSHWITVKTGASTSIATTANGFGAYHIYDLCRYISGTDTVRIYLDGAQIGVDTTTNVPIVDLNATIRQLNAGTSYADWIFIRKYTLNEPTWGSFGSEEPVPFYAITLPSTGWNTDWVILNGNFSTPPTGDGITQHGFDYGLTTSYGSSWTESGNWTTPAVFSKTVTGLSPATVYHYRAKVYYELTWYYGEDRTVSTQGSPTMYEYWDTGGDIDSFKINSGNVTYQTFTTNTTDISHSITSVKLKLKRVGTPGNVVASIRHTSNSTTSQTCWTYPTGEDIISATLDGDTFDLAYTWYEFIPDIETCLSANTTYAIVVKADSGDSSNYVMWQADFGGGYTGGNAGYSIDSGVAWVTNCPTDMLFEIWGNPCLEVLDAKVFTGYIEDGDWLITVLYKNFFAPYYEDAEDVQALFYLQLADGTTVKASTILPEWGYRPACIYLSATEVAALEWGEDYTVRILCNFGAYPYAAYSLQSSDWLGSDLTRLDSWVRTSASLMEDYYETTYTEYVAGKGLVLNEAGGVIFSNNIPELDVERPDIFKITTNTIGYESITVTHALQADLVWQTMWGPQITRAFTLTGNAFGLTAPNIGMIIGFMVYAFISLFCFRPGHALAAIVIPSPMLLIVWGTGLAELGMMGIFLAVASLLLVWQLWFKSR